VPIHDVKHILRCLGVDHKRLTYKFQGRISSHGRVGTSTKNPSLERTSCPHRVDVSDESKHRPRCPLILGADNKSGSKKRLSARAITNTKPPRLGELPRHRYGTHTASAKMRAHIYIHNRDASVKVDSMVVFDHKQFVKTGAEFKARARLHIHKKASSSSYISATPNAG